MPDLAYRQQKIQEKRKQTSFRDFVMEIASWMPMQVYRQEGIITRFPPTERSPKLCQSLADFYEVSVEQEFLSENSFFQQLTTFYQTRPHIPLFRYPSGNENTEFSDAVFGAKNAYLSFSVGGQAENVLYSSMVYDNVKNIFESVHIAQNSDNVFHSLYVLQSMNVFYSKFIVNSNNLRFCDNMIGCSECINCSGLENQSQCINNQKYDRETYFQKKDGLLRNKEMLIELWQSKSVKWQIIASPNSTGQGIVSSDTIENGYLVTNVRNGKNLFVGTDGENFIDGYDAGLNSKDLYACCGVGSGSSWLYFCTNTNASSLCFYCASIDTCSFCIGCIGIKNKSYCIFNKEYSKEEWHEKVNQIFEQMEKDWTLWQFFPATMNPFYFNDTAAYLIDPSFTKEEVEKAWYLRRDEPIKVDIPADLEQVHVRDLDQYEGYDENGKWHIDEEILKKVIIDEQGNVRRIVNMEYVFLMKYGLPLPRKHWIERMKENFRIG